MKCLPGSFISVLMALLVSVSICAADTQVVLDDGTGAERWRFIKGNEFPGATGNIESVLTTEQQPAVGINYDFSGGGKYVGGTWPGDIPQNISAVHVKASCSGSVKLFVRVVDAAGKTFHSHGKVISSGKVESLDIALGTNWENRWGGTGDHRKPQLPLKSIFVGANKSGENVSGTFLVHELSVDSAEDVSSDQSFTTGKGFLGFASGWKIRGAWGGGWNNPVLRLDCVSGPDAKTAEVLFTLPDLVRDKVKRYVLKPGKPSVICYVPPLDDGINPHQQYSIKVAVKSGNAQFTDYAVLAGLDADKDFFSVPKTSSEIESSIFGTCSHFAYGLSPAFRNWENNKPLIDIASRAGLKWLRDHVNLDRETGKIKQRDRDWVTYARDKGLSTVVCIRMYARETPEDFAAKAVKIVEQMRDLVSVYELGNEPENFGGWKEKYGGTWNGKEKDGSTSPWVKAHLKNTNAGADAIKKRFPEVTLIALGACPPTNFRYLDLGLSKSIDGIVEHPYSFALPAERVPWSIKLKERDGVETGDDKGSFRGLVESYFRKFRSSRHTRSLWVTEFGWPNYVFNGENEKQLYAAYTEQAQAAYILRRQILSLTLPISLSCQFNLMDNYNSKPFNPEGNFGLVNVDLQPKPAYYAVQRLTSVFAGFGYAGKIKVKVDAAPLHKAVTSKFLMKWDGKDIEANNDVEVYAFVSKKQPDVVQVAAWSAQPFGSEFSKRFAALRLEGMKGFGAAPVVYDLMSGESFDVVHKIEGNDLVLPRIMLGRGPIVIRLYKNQEK